MITFIHPFHVGAIPATAAPGRYIVQLVDPLTVKLHLVDFDPSATGDERYFFHEAALASTLSAAIKLLAEARPDIVGPPLEITPALRAMVNVPIRRKTVLPVEEAAAGRYVVIAHVYTHLGHPGYTASYYRPGGVTKDVFGHTPTVAIDNLVGLFPEIGNPDPTEVMMRMSLPEMKDLVKFLAAMRPYLHGNLASLAQRLAEGHTE